MRHIRALRPLIALLCVAFAPGLTGTAHASSTTDGRGGNGLSRLAVGQNWSCAIRDDDEVVCWYGTDGMPSPAGVSEARQVSVALRSACAVNRFGEVHCWKDNEVPQKVAFFGAGGLENHAVSVLVDAAIASKVARCAVVSTGNVYCWGGNEEGQLGDGTKIDRATPVKVKNVTQAVALFTGSSHTGTLKCALRLSGGVRCWGDGQSSPFAIQNIEGVREIAVTLDGLCVWRRLDDLTRVSCAPSRAADLSNFENFVTIGGLTNPQGLAANVYGGLCVADAVNPYPWRCMDLYYGLDRQPRVGFMTTLYGGQALAFGDQKHSCAPAVDGTWVRCMQHGMLVPPCDLATHGAACIDPAGSTAPAGTWSLVPNLALAQTLRPLMFGNPTDQRLDARTSTSLTISWKSPTQTTHHLVKICDEYMKCLAVSKTSYSGGRYSATASNLKPDTRYILFVDPSNWASRQGNFGFDTRTSR